MKLSIFATSTSKPFRNPVKAPNSQHHQDGHWPGQAEQGLQS